MEVTNKIHKGFTKEFLNKSIDYYQESYYIIGSFFEELTNELFKGYTERLDLDNDSDICPDLHEVNKREFFIECKAAKRGTYNSSKTRRTEWKMKTESIDNYTDFFKTYFPSCSLKEPDFNPVLLYAFWSYDIGNVKAGDFDKSRKLIRALTYSNIKLYLMDSFILRKIFELKTLSRVPSMGDGLILFRNGSSQKIVFILPARNLD